MRLLLRLLLISVTVMPVSAKAAQVFPLLNDYQWSLGADVSQWYAASVGDMRKILASSKAGTAIFLAYRTEGDYAFELGYAWSDRKPKSYLSVPNAQAFGATATTTSNNTVKVRIKDTYFDAFRHMPINKCFEAKFGIGLGFVREKFKSLSVPANSADPMQVAIDGLEGRTAVTLRFLVGAQTMIHERVGIRMLLKYQTMSAVNARNTVANVNMQMYKNSYSASLGIFWTFLGHDVPPPVF